MSLTKNGVTNNLVPTEFYLSQNYPNPFKERTTIKYCVPYKTKVKITVFNSEDEPVEVLVDEDKKPGTYEVKFSASNCHSGEVRNLTAGDYHFSLEAGEYKNEKKMQIIK
jgi:hypothetical protein